MASDFSFPTFFLEAFAFGSVALDLDGLALDGFSLALVTLAFGFLTSGWLESESSSLGSELLFWDFELESAWKAYFIVFVFLTIS